MLYLQNKNIQIQANIYLLVNYNITNNDISLSYSKNLITEEDNQFKIENNEKKKNNNSNNINNIDKSNSNSTFDIKIYDDFNNSNDNLDYDELAR